ncbi:hypothetical protein ASZ78_006067 [Callipepla squamata]|uniref:Uncharacterized protein n=2 Tax=Callipepla squamata TaxID=9009 RepID=A0A226MZH9_CALSU|nr:hypothetical protein ASZ78_006067 [Callipepla squamata]
MKTVRVSVRGDNEYQECIVSPPAVPAPIGFGTITVPSGTAGPSEAARAGGLLPEEWAGLFRERRELLWPVQRWLEDIFSQVPELRWWQITALEGAILTLLCQLGLDRDALVQRAQRSLGPITAPLIDGLIETVVSRCGREARRLLGLQEPSTAQQQQREQQQRAAGAAAAAAGAAEQRSSSSQQQQQQQQQREQQRGPAAPSGPTVALSAVPSGSPTAPDAEELPGTSSGALAGGAGELPAALSPGQRERPGDEPGPEAAGPSEQGRSRGPSARGPRRSRKRRAGSAQSASPPCKRRLL